MWHELWFDVEKRYNTTNSLIVNVSFGCGLMQRNDIIQLSRAMNDPPLGCGLMQRNDIIQPSKEPRGTDVVVV